MCISFVFTLFALSLLNKMCQTQLMIPLAEKQTFPCTVLTNTLIVFPSDLGLLMLNRSNFEIRLSIIPQDCIYLYTVTNIGIRIGDPNDEINIDDYSITYRVNNTMFTVPLRQITSSTDPFDSMFTRVNIYPLVIEELWISRFINSDGNFQVRYGINGISTPRTTVLNYLIAEPTNRDDTYTGVCNGEVCYRGKGRLMDGYIGDNSDIFRSQSNLSWNCSSDDGCNFPLRIQLTGHVCYIKLHGFNSTDLNIVIPNVTLINPKLETNLELSKTSTNTYSIEIPINNTVTSEIFLYMNVPMMSRLVLSEVKVISNEVNIAPFEPPSSPTNTNNSPTNTTSSPTNTNNSPTNTTSSLTNNSPTDVMTSESINIISYVIFPLLIVIMLIIITSLVVISLYISIRNRNVKHQPDIGKLPAQDIVSINRGRIQNDDFSRYSERVHHHNAIYATIGPDIPQSERPKPNNVFENSDTITNTYVESGSLSENPIYPGKKDLVPGIETLETPLHTLTESTNSNGEGENQARYVEKTCEQEKEKPECERDDLQNESQVFDMRNNSIYKDVESEPQGYEQLNLKNEDNPGYDALKH